MDKSFFMPCKQRPMASWLAKGRFLAIVTLFYSALLGAEEASFSRANELLFNSNHFANAGKTSTLEYEFVKSGSAEEGFVDRIELKLEKSATPGNRRVEVDYFTDHRHRYVPPVEDTKGNPVLMLFLQRDVNEMARLTQGPWRHFQNRIKLALADDARIKSVSVGYQGRQIQATQITLHPYLEDPKRDRFSRFADKYYVFTLAEDVPGAFYQIRSVIPTQTGKEKDGSVLIEETLTFRPGD